MKAKTEELLYFLLWTCEKAFRPTWRNLEESFEGWALTKETATKLDAIASDFVTSIANETGDSGVRRFGRPITLVADRDCPGHQGLRRRRR